MHIRFLLNPTGTGTQKQLKSDNIIEAKGTSWGTEKLIVPIKKTMTENIKVTMDAIRTLLNERDVVSLPEDITGTVKAGFIVCTGCAIFYSQQLNWQISKVIKGKAYEWSKLAVFESYKSQIKKTLMLDLEYGSLFCQ